MQPSSYAGTVQVFSLTHLGGAFGYGPGEVFYTGWMADFRVYTASILKVYFTMFVSTDANPTYTFRTRIGGTANGVDGTIAATAVRENPPAPRYVRGEGTFANPNAVAPVKITIDTPGAIIIAFYPSVSIHEWGP
jgi:hypothetical protein